MTMAAERRHGANLADATGRETPAAEPSKPAAKPKAEAARGRQRCRQEAGCRPAQASSDAGARRDGDARAGPR